MIEIAVETRGQLHPAGPHIAKRWIGGKGGFDIPVMFIQQTGETDRVLHRHTGAGGQILQHRMRRVAEQRDPPFGPFLYRRPVAQHPHFPDIDLVQKRLYRPLHTFEMGIELIRIAIFIPALDIAGRMKNGDDVKQLSPPQLVMHQMVFRPRP